ncbi:MAG TPA: ATP-binding protein [Clostridiales bacterium]|nr:ATP-binding protein [Clostridiales bacterium]
MRFIGFEGNQDTKNLLSSFVDRGRIPHAILIEGPQGSGRRTLAKIIAQAAVCSSGDEKPCGVCSHCRKALSGNHPDIILAGGDGSSRSFHIDAVRQLRESAYILPNEAEHKVFILAGAEGMTEQAQNALLKILEEPPKHLIFILTCESRSQLLPTIQSRTVCLTVGAVDVDLAVNAIMRILPETSPEEARQAAAVFGGIIGQAVNGISDGTFKQVVGLAPQIALAVAAPNEIDLLRLTGKIEKDKAACDGVLNTLSLIFRDALVLRSGYNSSISSSPDTAASISKLLTKGQLAALVEEVDRLKRARLSNMNQTLFVTLMCSRLREAAGR